MSVAAYSAEFFLIKEVILINVDCNKSHGLVIQTNLIYFFSKRVTLGNVISVSQINYYYRLQSLFVYIKTIKFTNNLVVALFEMVI